MANFRKITGLGFGIAILAMSSLAHADDSYVLTVEGVDGYSADFEGNLPAGSAAELQKLAKFYSDRQAGRPVGVDVLVPREQNVAAGVCNRLMERAIGSDQDASDIVRGSMPGDRLEWRLGFPDGTVIGCTFTTLADQAPNLDAMQLLTSVFVAQADLNLGVVHTTGATEFTRFIDCLKDYMSQVGGNHTFGSAWRICRELMD